MSAQQDDGKSLTKVENLILKTEEKIDEQLALIEQLAAQEEDKEDALEGLVALINALNELAELKIALMK